MNKLLLLVLSIILTSATVGAGPQKGGDKASDERAREALKSALRTIPNCVQNLAKAMDANVPVSTYCTRECIAFLNARGLTSATTSSQGQTYGPVHVSAHTRRMLPDVLWEWGMTREWERRR